MQLPGLTWDRWWTRGWRRAGRGQPAHPASASYQLAIEVIVGLVIVAAPVLVTGYQLQLATRTLILCLLALSLDMAWGFGGVFDLGRAILFGWPAYAAALIATRAHVTAGVIVLPVAAVLGAAIALMLGAFLFLGLRRYNVIFVAISTLVLSYISQETASTWPYVGSANGIPNVPLLTAVPWSRTALQLGTTFYYMVTGLLILAYLGLRFLTRSQFGLVLAAIREEETADRAGFLGYDTVSIRLAVYVISGAVAGLAGGLYGFHEGYVSPDLLGVVFSTQVILWVLIGGRGTLIGAVAGALVMNYVSLRLSGTFLVVWQIILGLLLVVVITLLPRGLTGLLLHSASSNFGRYREQVNVTATPDQVTS